MEKKIGTSDRKNDSTSLVMKEMQIKTTRFRFVVG